MFRILTGTGITDNEANTLKMLVHGNEVLESLNLAGEPTNVLHPIKSNGSAEHRSGALPLVSSLPIPRFP